MSQHHEWTLRTTRAPNDTPPWSRLRRAVRHAGRACLAALALALPWLPAQAADIVIGQIAPLSGVLASTGKQMVLGGSLYFRHVNATGGCARPEDHGAGGRRWLPGGRYRAPDA